MKSKVAVTIYGQQREFRKCEYKHLAGQSYLFECWENYDGERHHFYIVCEHDGSHYSNCHVEELVQGTDDHYSYPFDHSSLVVNGKRVEPKTRNRCNYMIAERIA